MIALTIAGSDSGGGAGIQADLKTFSALGVYGASVLTALTAQNTHGVFGVHPVPAPFVRAQLKAVLDDLDVAAIKVGMVADAEVIAVLAEDLATVSCPVVVDPVMVAASGDRLLADEAVVALRDSLLPVATVITPNLPEAGALLGEPVAETVEEMRRQGETLRQLGPSVLVKGGHLADGDSTDLLLTGDGAPLALTAPRIKTDHTHGTGCTLSSAIAAYLAKGHPLEVAVREAKHYITAAIAAADTLSIGTGKGPVHHFHDLWRAQEPA
ncbi:MAG: bifunctional hydroxymethylpyrimidine kinase/phosphomethylpyrimidine kinase [Pseudomonadota bacterium]